MTSTTRSGKLWLELDAKARISHPERREIHRCIEAGSGSHAALMKPILDSYVAMTKTKGLPATRL